jgi:uncharacterized protein (TIGR03000 family)
MLKNILTSGALFISAASAVCLTAVPALAQHGGGGHGGGGHGGGGGFHGGGFGGGFHGGGFHSSGFHGGFHPGFAHPHSSFPFSHQGFRHDLLRSFGFPFFGGYYPYYGWDYPYYGGDYGQWPYADDYVPFGTAAPSYSDGSDPYSYQSLPPPTSTLTPPQANASARLTVKVPADADVWIDGTKTTSSGTTRAFESPLLEAGYRYSYEVRATWKENGHQVTQTQTVPVSPGMSAEVIFLAQPTPAPQPSATKMP